MEDYQIALLNPKKIGNNVCDFFIDELTENTVGEFNPNFYDQITLSGDNSMQSQRLAFNDYIEMSRKGLYSYDSYGTKSEYGNYFRISYPHKPLKLENLPIKIQNILKRTCLKNVDFRQGKDIKF